jgi:hypothetical protein
LLPITVLKFYEIKHHQRIFLPVHQKLKMEMECRIFISILTVAKLVMKVKWSDCHQKTCFCRIGSLLQKGYQLQMEWESMMQSKFHIVLLLKVPKHENFELPFTLSDSIWKAYLLTQKCFFFILVLIWWNFAWWMSYFFFNLGQNLKFLVVTFRPICMLIMCFSKNFKVWFCFECS